MAPEAEGGDERDGKVELTFEAKGLVEVKRWSPVVGSSVTVREPKKGLHLMLPKRLRRY